MFSNRNAEDQKTSNTLLYVPPTVNSRTNTMVAVSSVEGALHMIEILATRTTVTIASYLD